ncbi:hypothetical protein ES708_12068 [subsurface metagenome]
MIFSSGELFCNTNALIPCLASIMAPLPPTFASLIPLVKGLLLPAEVRAEFGNGLPVSEPFAIISLFSGPSGSQFGGTSS